MNRPTTIHRRRELLDEAIALLEQEYAGSPDLDDLAFRLATSRRQLQSCFEEHAGASFRSCLWRIRMERAAELLTSTDLPVREVAARVGYRQPAQFAKAFARRHGVAPTEYRVRERLPVAA